MRNLEIKNVDHEERTFEIWEDGQAVYKAWADADDDYYLNGWAKPGDIVQFLKHGDYSKI